jgi:hypothetical protein
MTRINIPIHRGSGRLSIRHHTYDSDLSWAMHAVVRGQLRIHTPVRQSSSCNLVCAGCDAGVSGGRLQPPRQAEAVHHRGRANQGRAVPASE